MTSPSIVPLAGEPGGKLESQAALGADRRAAPGRFADLSFELVEVLAEVSSVAICYAGVWGVHACELLRFRGDAKAMPYDSMMASSLLSRSPSSPETRRRCSSRSSRM
jgi:hypothetical protein